MFKRIALFILFAACYVLWGAPARADLIKQSAAFQRTVLMTDSADHVTGKTGLTLTITLSKAGAAYASITPTVTELGSGLYSVALTTSHTGTLGALDLHVTGTGADPSDTHDQVVAFDPGDASLLGLTGVATAATQTSQGTTIGTINANASTAATQSTTAATQATTAATASSGLRTDYTTARAGKLDSLDVAVSTRLASASYTAPTTPPTVSQIAGGILATPANLLLTNGSGYVTTSNPATGGSAVTEATIWAYGTRSLTDKTGFSGTATNLPSDYQQRGVAVTLPTTAPAGYGGSGGGGTYPLANTTGTYTTPGTVGYYIANSLARRTDIPTFPTNFGLLSISGSGGVALNLAQALDTSNTGDTVGGGLLAARAQGFGKWVISGTPGQAGSTLSLYAANGTTVERQFSLATSGSRQ